jgi:hypothetical protein
MFVAGFSHFLVHTVLGSRDDEPVAFVVGKITDEPIYKDNDLVAETNERKQMHEHPYEPRKEALEAQVL